MNFEITSTEDGLKAYVFPRKREFPENFREKKTLEKDDRRVETL